MYGAVSWGEFEGAEEGGEFGALVGLAGGGREGFGEVSTLGRGRGCQSVRSKGMETAGMGDRRMRGNGKMVGQSLRR